LVGRPEQSRAISIRHTIRNQRAVGNRRIYRIFVELSMRDSPREAKIFAASYQITG
jgi:hypothetical protein